MSRGGESDRDKAAEEASQTRTERDGRTTGDSGPAVHKRCMGAHPVTGGSGVQRTVGGRYGTLL